MKTTLIRFAVAAAALTAPLMTGSAHAATVGVAVGTGTISPSVPTTGCVNNATFELTGTAAALGTDYGPGPYDFTVSGVSGTCASILTDTGAATMSGDVTGTLTYSRTLGAMNLTGNLSVEGAPAKPATIVCEVVPTSANPVATFGVVCAVTI